MEISTARIEQVAKTLPIGYYAKRNISAIVKEGEKTSYYSPMDDSIVISADIIKTAMNCYPEGYDEETAIRSMLYHEVSHAIMTPDVMPMTPIRNIFEDERIETLLGNYYMDVNFKEQVYAINPTYCGQPPTNALDAFYQTVRFRNGHSDDLSMVDDIIAKYSHINKTNYDDVWDYCCDISRLYDQIADRYGFPKTWEDGRGKSGSILTEPSENGIGTLPTGTSNENADNNSVERKANGCTMKIPKTPFVSSETFNKAIEAFQKVSAKYIDKHLTEAFEMIFNSFNKRTTNNGTCMNGYSGVFDPRSVARDDYKFFIRKNSRGNGKGFSKFNLNLFLDSSGSFCRNLDATNTILKSLTEMENRNPMFTFTLTALDTEIHELFGAKRIHFADGSNYLTPELVDVYNKKQRTDAVNYNIVLFDGYTDGGKNFKAFNHSNCTIIAESSNEENIRKYSPSAKLIIENNYYPEKLKENILNILTIALG